MRRLAGTLLVTLCGCLVPNPAYDEPTGSTSRGDGGSTGGPASTTGAPTTSMSGGSEGSGSAGESTSAAATTDPAVTGGPTTGGSTTEMSAGTGSTGPDGESTGAPEMDCQEMPLEVELLPKYDAYFIRGDEGGFCTFPVEQAPASVAGPCDLLNFGESVYAGVGALGGMRNLYAVQFGLHEQLAGMGIDPQSVIDARLKIVAWSDVWRPETKFDVELIAASNDWLAGGKNKVLATIGDSSFKYRKIVQGQPLYEWGGGEGPRSGATAGAKLVVPEGQWGDEHPYQLSEPIPRKALQGWLDDPNNEQGLVVSSDKEPYLLKIIGSCCSPYLVVRYCPM